MITQKAQAVWRGGLKQGTGSFRSGTIEGQYSFASRFEGGAGSTPEELIAAAHASCFSMALSLYLEQAGKRPDSIRTTATVQLDPEKLAITRIDLDTEAVVPGLSESEFQKLADQAKQNCPVSKALAGVDIAIKSAKLAKPAGARA
jgi:osmotically inducible protein OsmC